jgi:hypothetical protein
VDTGRAVSEPPGQNLIKGEIMIAWYWMLLAYFIGFCFGYFVAAMMWIARER